MKIKQDCLEVVSIEVSTKCNLACSHCFALADIPNREDMNIHTALEIVKEGYDTGFRILHITGGEPFLWKHIFDLLDYAIALEYEQILVNTNATLLTNEFCQKIKKYGEKIILTCSINGDKNLHESVRGANTYIKSSTGIKNALIYNIHVDIYTTVEKKLLPVLPVFVDGIFKAFPELKNLVLIQLRKTKSKTVSIFEKMLSPDDFIKLVRMTGFLSLRGYPVNILENPLANVVADFINMNWLPKSPQITRYGKIIVLSNGNITANHSSRNSYGIYKNGMLKTVVTSEKYLNDMKPESAVCPECEFFNVCRSNGMVHPSSKDHNNSQDDVPFCKKVLQLCSLNAKLTKESESAK